MADAVRPALLWRAALGLLCLDAAFALLVALAAHPPARPLEIRIALPAGPAPARPVVAAPRDIVAAAPREIVVPIANADRAAPLPPPVVARYAVTVPIRAAAARPAELATLTDGAGAAVGAPSNADAIAAAPVPASFAPERAPVPSRADRLLPADAPVAALADPPDLERGPVDQLTRAAAPSPIDDACACALPAPASDRLVTAAPALALAEAPWRGGALADGLVPSPAPALVGRDETGRTAGARAWSSEPPRPELLPTARPSPAVLLAHWLPELSSPATTAELKTQFVRLLLPLVMQVNEDILQRRDRVIALAPRIESGAPLSEADAGFVAELLPDMRLDSWDTDELLLRIDAVPLSMALAQAAQESGWGRSRPAREDNALFGQMAFAPATRPQVQPFGDLLETVTAYARNLNSHPAYAEFRRRRAALRARGDALDGHALVPFIERYSERGLGYVEAIRELMRMNNLLALDVRVLDGTLDAAVPDAPVPDGSAPDAPALEAAAPAGDGLAVDRLLPEPSAPEPPPQGMDN
jgi:Bax protein